MATSDSYSWPTSLAVPFASPDIIRALLECRSPACAFLAFLGLLGSFALAVDLESLEPGKLADLIVPDKNPLEDIRNTEAIRMVMKNGRLYQGDDLQEMAPQAEPAGVLVGDGSAGRKVRRATGGREVTS